MTDKMPEEWAMSEIEKMIDSRQKQAVACERMLELLQPEWDKFEAREGHSVYVARDYADHSSALRTHLRELKALNEALAALKRGITLTKEANNEQS